MTGSSNSRRRAWQRRRAPQPPQVATLEPSPASPEEADEEQPKSYIQQLQEEFDIPGFVEVYEGEGGQPLVFLMHPSGHSLEIYLQGATITRWLKPDGKSIIFTRPDAVFEPGVAINSGVPIIFPQWREGQLPENGFADKLMWDLVGTNLGFEFANMLEQPDFAAGDLEPVDLAGDLEQQEDGTWVPAELPELGELQEAEEVESATAEADDDGDDEGEEQRREGDVEEDEEASTSGQEEVPDEFYERFVEGLVGDPSPFVILRLADNSVTRSMWPHSFELLLKISLQETDDFQDPKADLPKGPMEFYSEADLTAAVEGGANDRTTSYDAEEAEEGEDDADDAPQEGGLDLRRTAVDGEDLPDYDEECPMQVKLEFLLTHTGGADEGPLEFQLGALPHFSTRDQRRYGRFVRSLGLGGKQAFDWSYDPRHARLSAMDGDYLTYGERRIETVVIGAHDADVRFCPGDRTHVQLLSREGFKDAVAYHPGPYPPPGQEAFSPYYAALGAGRLALPKRLNPGEEWRAEFVLRHHNRYWDAPIFDQDALQPMPPFAPAADPEEGETDDDGFEGQEGEDDWEAQYEDDDDADIDIEPGV